MERATSYSWILLAIDLVGRKSPASLERIIEAADAINHSPPMHYEIQEAIGWLMQEGLISEKDNEYNLTEQGRGLMAEVKAQTSKLFDGWDWLKMRFVASDAPMKIANISQIEWQKALETYHNRAKGRRRA